MSDTQIAVSVNGNHALSHFSNSQNTIRIRGARQHNLKNIDLEIPRDRLIVFTGVSGSGKSSLAFDTIFAEGQRRYVESLSAYARQFLGQLDKPDVEAIEGLSPAISIDQKSTSHNPRSTVGTVTEIYDYMRLLYGRAGQPHCPMCDRNIAPQTIDEMVDRIMELPDRTKFQILAPVVRGKKGTHKKLLSGLASQGFVRIRIDGEIRELSDSIELDKNLTHTIEVVIDRLVKKDGLQERLVDSLSTCLKLSEGIVVILYTPTTPSSEEETVRAGSTNQTDHKRKNSINPPPPTDNPPTNQETVRAGSTSQTDHKRQNSINPPPPTDQTPTDQETVRAGSTSQTDHKRKNSINPPPPTDQTPTNQETVRAGSTSQTDHKRKNSINPPPPTDNPEDQEMVFSENFACPEHGAVMEELSPRLFSFNSPYGACVNCHGIGFLKRFSKELVVPDPDAPIYAAIAPWSEKENSYYLELLYSLGQAHGFELQTQWSKLTPEQCETILNGEEQEKGSKTSTFRGVLPILQRQYEGGTELVKQKLEQYLVDQACPVCQGKRLKPEALSVRLGQYGILDLTSVSIRDCQERVDGLKLNPRQAQIADLVLREVKARLQFLLDVGLDYLTLDRAAMTLSGGEAQRIRLATQIGSGLTGVLYVLDEPSIGLHQRDNERLLRTLTRLRDLGNTLIVVEHDEETIRAADYIVDIGPGAGMHGGNIVAQGDLQALLDAEDSLTGAYLSGRRVIHTPAKRREGNGLSLMIKNASRNNLLNINVDIPLGELVSVTGVSGSGKSTLINELVYPALQHHITKKVPFPKDVEGIQGLSAVDKAIVIDQSPIGRTPRSNPATYTGVFDIIRDVFSQTVEAKARGYKPGQFSFNVKGGRCEACSGQGVNVIEMNFLPDVYVQCEVCKGARYNRETLQVKYKDKSISDVLNMTVEESLDFFQNIPKAVAKLQTLFDVGLGYVRLGQPATTLSGGEAQRVKLATELSRRATGKTLYLIDEPTTGLSFYDVHKLLDVLQRLVDKGNSVLLIEHNLDVIRCSDWVIDLGPEGGDKGGEIVAVGTPEDVAKNTKSYTGKYLQQVLKQYPAIAN